MNTDSDNGVLVFVKYPTPGRVKTRLAEELGGERAAELYKHFVVDILDTLGDLDVKLKILFTPPNAEQEFRLWLGDEYTYAAQDGEDLGQRMKKALGEAFADGFAKAIVVGSDSPDVPGDYVMESFSSLDSSDAVIGPTSDGGYYLIGFSKESFLPEALEDIDWSTPKVLEQTVGKLETHGRKIHLLQQWYDVDTLADLEALTRRKLKAHF